MKKHFYILFILLLLCISNSFAQQNWQEMMYDTTKNFYDIQAAFYEGCGDLPCDSAPMFKQFKRWESHMEPRVYPTGVFDAETVFNEFLEVYNENNNRHNPTHTYASGGAFNVTLTATNSYGSSSETYNNYINVVPLSGSPVSNITATGSYDWFGTTYYCPGTYYYVSPSCQDYTLNLTVNNPLISTTNVTECDEYTWDISGQQYTSSGTYYQSVLAPQGCFADKKLILTINASTEASQTHSATYSYSCDGENYFCSGTYYHYSTNAAGCPHTDILYLNIE
jgi:hypothetical protein